MKWLIAAAALAFGTVALAQDDKPMQPEQPASKPAEKPAELPQDNLPAAAELFEKHIAAVGGLDVMKAERNRLVRAKFSAPGGAAEGMLRVIRVAPNKMAQVLEIPGVVTQELWFTGEEAWKRDTNTGAKKVQGDELTEVKLQADILGECNYKARYREIKTLAREMFSGAKAYSVRAVSQEGKERTLYFDAVSGLLIGIKATSVTGLESVVTLSDYKKFGEIMHPTRTVIKMGEAEAGTITVTQIESNLSVPPTVNPPDEVRAVK